MNITFVPFQEIHLSLLREWLNMPHVKPFWIESADDVTLRNKYLENLPQRGITPQIILLDEQPIGFIQSYQACQVGGGWWPQSDSGVFGIDQLIGEAHLIGQGLGPQIILTFIQQLSTDLRVQEIIVDPDPSNTRAIRAYEKVGFKKMGIITTPNGKAMLMRFRVRCQFPAEFKTQIK